MPDKRDFFDALAAEVLHNYGRGRAIIAVDGLPDAGTTAFADDLAAAFKRVDHGVFRASMRDFHRPRAERVARGDSPSDFYRDAFDYSRFRRVLIEPFRMGGSTGFVTRDFDLERDMQIEPKWQSGPADAILIVDGLFVNRPELSSLWNYSIWLEVPVPLQATDVETNAVVSVYRKDTDPTEKATALISNTDPDNPQRIFADSC
ncbi:uridine kinase [Diaminobutyricimonas sp. TR449]|uniref:uridine kinase n=1 Tax=Diaminobutyricimonas sp. TR449 TaxID=2708076 RepID=UPI00141DDA2F|nr:uridine kinase [Diaminobutyricimonas sp. TR449]